MSGFLPLITHPTGTGQNQARSVSSALDLPNRFLFLRDERVQRLQQILCQDSQVQNSGMTHDSEEAQMKSLFFDPLAEQECVLLSCSSIPTRYPSPVLSQNLNPPCVLWPTKEIKIFSTKIVIDLEEASFLLSLDQTSFEV